jgi:hypothetical protein
MYIFVSVRLFLQLLNKLIDFCETLYEHRVSKFNPFLICIVGGWNQSPLDTAAT